MAVREPDLAMNLLKLSLKKEKMANEFKCETKQC